MTISTIIPYRAGKQWRPAEGPTMCARCHVGLLHRSSDRVEETVDLQTNAELTVHIWEHDVDSEGRALCPSCTEVDDQTEAWRQLVAWCHRSDVRQLHVRCSGVWLEENREHVRMFVAISGRLPVPDVLAFVGRDPLRPGATVRPPKTEAPRFELLAGDMHEATMEMGANLRADDECPETERNTER